MKPIITPEEAGRLDGAAGDPVGVLMERAGLAVALAAVRMGAGYGSRVLVLAGPGNNGGDGYVAARFLRRRGVAVEVRALGYPKGEGSPARRAAAAAAAAGVPARPLGMPEDADLVVDALFGAGFRGELPDSVVPWTSSGTPVLAIDLPSGVDGADGSVGGAAFAAARTVTFGALKVGHLFGEGPDRCGAVEVADIGLPDPRPELLLCEDGDAPLPSRARTAHKWNTGAVLVVGGSPGIDGAPLLASTAALYGGAGYVRLVHPGGLRSVAGRAPVSVTTRGAGAGERFEAADVPGVLEAGERFDVMALGPGLGPGTAGFVAGLVEAWDRPLVLDADGITAVTPGLLAGRTAPTVVTPHGGEFRRLAGTDPTYGAAAGLAASTGAVVLLKGNPTVVAGIRRWVVASGGPELATLGTGDVLTGLLAALIARGLDPETAARSAAYRHGLAGASLASRQVVTAGDLAVEVGRWSG
jgi:NAD(P)H-hydrate epimerase